MKKLMFGRRLWIILIATVVIFGGVFVAQWYGKRMMNQAMDQMGQGPATVSATQARVVNLQPRVSAVGTLMPVNGADLTTEVPGIVREIHFDNGAAVEKGDVILTLDSEADRAQLAALEAAARLAELELERARTLVAQRNLSKSELDRRQSELDQARANARAQKARIEQKTLRAPYDGQLGIRRFNVGDYVAAGEPIIGLQALDPLFVNFTLPARHNDTVAPGTEVQARVDALMNGTFSGEVTAIEPSVDPDTRNFQLQATISNPEQRLKPGMFATLSLPLGEAGRRVMVPQTAISYRPYGNSVFVIEETGGTLKVVQRFVTLGETRGDLVAVTEGLSAEERVATSGLLKLRSGLRVKIDNSITPTADLNPTPDNG